MRKYQKREILEMLVTIQQAYQEIEKQLSLEEIKQVLDLLAQCQEAMIGVGNAIEEWEEGEANLIAEIVEYCERIFEVYSEIQQGNQQSGMCKMLEEGVAHIKVRVEQEINVKYEVLFLPYKASMWDSLESIWKAAKEDADYKCYVMPIPYYDKNRDGSIGQLYYEGELFPDDVPIVKYTEYNIQERRPDIIYIHNPYDNYNYVTTVHPSYYSKVLKEYTDLLVYVPYYVTTNKVNKVFCTTAGIINADKVILQSKYLKDIYSKAYNELLIECNEDVSMKQIYDITNNKFLALGSPKIDKVLDNIDKKIDLPEEWSQLIREKMGRGLEADISDVKIVLYNTHLEDLLVDGEEYLRKLKYVFNSFKKDNNTVLLWRPHPLSIESAQAMNPTNLQEYKRMVTYYKEEKIGIYDDTADLHRAIAISDGYYGDWSSLVPMYGVTGKPIMMQNKHIIDEAEEAKQIVFCEDCYIEEDVMWFANFMFNGLFKADINTGKVEFLGHFPKEALGTQRLHASIKKYKEQLIFTPAQGRYISIYNMKDNTFKTIEVEDSKFKYAGPKFAASVQFNEYIFMIPQAYHAIIRLNVETEEVTYITKWYEKEKVGQLAKDAMLFRREGVSIGNKVYLASGQHNAIFEFNMETLEGKYIKVGKQFRRFKDVCYDGKYFYLAPRDAGGIVRWKRETGQVKVFGEDVLNYQFGFFNIMFHNGMVWGNYDHGKGIVKLDPISEKLEFEPVQPSKDFYLNLGNEYILFKIYKERMYLLNSRDLYMYEYDGENLKRKTRFIQDKVLNTDVLKSFINLQGEKEDEKEVGENDLVMYESYSRSLEYFKGLLIAGNRNRTKYSDCFMKLYFDEQKHSGMEIFKACKREVE